MALALALVAGCGVGEGAGGGAAGGAGGGAGEAGPSGPATADHHPGGPPAGVLVDYQLGGGYTPGTALGGMLAVSALAVLGVGRARRSGMRAVVLLPAGLATTVLGTAAAMEFSWRYQLPGLVLLPLSAVFSLPYAIVLQLKTRLTS